MAAPSAEIQFAQRLAANEKTIRDRALKKLRKYIRSRSATASGFTEEDLIKLWKGLHYCMWMQDKPLLQEELAVHITRLIFSFPDLGSSLMFFKVFLDTETREWNGIDRLRMDKFMMLVRQMTFQMFVVLKQDGWQEKSVEKWADTLRCTLLDSNSDRVPDSLAMHLADIFLPELTKVGSEQLESDKILCCLKVFDNYLQVGKRPLVLARILSSVYDRLVEQTAERARRAAREMEGEKEKEGKEEGEDMSGDSDSGYDEDSQPKLKFDSELIAGHLFEIGSEEKCSNSNRQKLYNTVKRLRDASSGTPENGVADTEEYDPDEDLDAAVERLNKMNPVKKKKKKKKQTGEEEEEAEEEEMEEEREEEEKTAGRKKNRKRKLNETEGQGQGKVKVISKDSSSKDQDSSTERKKAKVTEKDSLKSTETTDGQKKKKRKKKKKKAKIPESENTKTQNTTETDKAEMKGDNSVLKGGNSVLKGGNSVLKGGNSAVKVDGNKVKDTPHTKESNRKDQLQQQKAEDKVSPISTQSIKKSKKKKKRTSNTPTEEIPSKKTKTESDSNSSNSISKQLFKDATPGKKSDRKAVESSKSDFDEPLKSGETEIWVPSKKYLKKKEKSGETPKHTSETPKPTAKGTPKAKTPKQVIEKLEVKSAKGKRQSTGSDFAKFEKVSTPAAFVKKAVIKASAKTPVKQAETMKKSTPEMTASEKKVKFNMKKNMAQKFEDSMTISPLPAFIPAKSPVQGILKSPATPQLVRTPGSKKKNKKRKLSLSVDSKQDNGPVLMLSSKTLESVGNTDKSLRKSKKTPLKNVKKTSPIMAKVTPLKNVKSITANVTPLSKGKSTPFDQNMSTPKSGKKAEKEKNATPHRTPKSGKKNKKTLQKTPNTENEILKETPKSIKKISKSNGDTPKSGKKNSKMATPKSMRRASNTPGQQRSQASDFF